MLKHIVLHGPSVDNVGNFADAGSELTVGAAAKEGFITAERAQELVDGNRAISRTAAQQLDQAPKSAKVRSARKAAPKAKPAAQPAPSVPATPIEPKASASSGSAAAGTATT